MVADSDRLGEVLERCIAHLAQHVDAEIVDIPIPLRVRYTREDGGISSVNDSSPLRTSDIDILARAFVNMNQDAEEIPDLTNQTISGKPNEEGGSQLALMGIDLDVYLAVLKQAEDKLDAQLDVNRECLKIISNLTELLKQRG